MLVFFSIYLGGSYGEKVPGVIFGLLVLCHGFIDYVIENVEVLFDAFRWS